ncbi:UNVERIFIED_CONTAM: hypothetical protein RMT77_005361 [Armadillidium vulgare]
MSSPEELRNLITSHIAINMFPETAFEPGLIYSIDGLSSNFKVKKNNEGKLTVNGANVLSSHMSANGVIHVVDKVFKPSDGESYASVKRTSISTVTHRNGTTSTRTFVSTSKSSGRTHHRRVTVNEGYGKDIEEILPAFPQEAGKISYVGHPYGDDVVGHSSEPLPFTSAGSSYVSRNNNSVREVIRPIPQYVIDNEESKIHGVSTITHSKRVGVTRTVITHPSSSSYVAKSSRSFSFPINKKPIPSIGLDGKPRSTLLSAYAFTGEEQDFADGSEFSESRLPSEHIITVEQAKILRRQWRRKRHHQSKLKKQNKKGHKRGQKRNDKKHRKHKIEKENNENNTL